MNGSGTNTLSKFKNLVGTRFQLYNSLFTNLPFHKVEKTGVLLSLFIIHCEEGYEKGKSPDEIVSSFLTQYTTYTSDKEQRDLLFRFIQYAERQVVLFDALEDAAFRDVNDMNGVGTLKHLTSEVSQKQAQKQLAQKLKDYSVRLVLTAHPTQFYPSEVLVIIHDMARALIKGDTALVNTFLQQLGKTPFFKQIKPTPYDEAVSLIWFLENVFYKAAGNIQSYMKSQFPKSLSPNNKMVQLGFWPGGDRDGNPYVDYQTSEKVANELRGAIIKCYYQDVRRLKRRLTFRGVKDNLEALESKLYQNLFNQENPEEITSKGILLTLRQIRKTLHERHSDLFVDRVDDLICKVELFGLYFASLDIRQDSSVHIAILDEIAQKSDALPDNYSELSDKERIEVLVNNNKTIEPDLFDDVLFKDTIQTIRTIKKIQSENGEHACHRYIISHTTSALNMMEVYGLFKLSGWKPEDISVDIVPLFETIDDLRAAGDVMRELYEHKDYRDHLARRDNTQIIMLGFSDGTKDGGYLMANWSIYKAKEELSLIAKEYDVEIAFFDGRGGPPARGGGKTHQFYASMGNNISNKEIQLTVQGQTISSHFGNVDSAQFNIEQLMHAGISNAIFEREEMSLSKDEESVMQRLADESFEAFCELKNNDAFLEYLNFASPLRYYGETNIGSRPSKRSNKGKLNLDDLRAVPFVGAWSQLKQNLPGYYGVGLAFEKLDKEGKWDDVVNLYHKSLYFKTLMDNCEMAMKKSFFPLTQYLADHKVYGEFWERMHTEFKRTHDYMLKLTDAKELMEDKPVDSLSIKMRQRIELPLLTIQQHALTKIRDIEEHGGDEEHKKSLEKLVIRCSFGIINAERNSA